PGKKNKIISADRANYLREISKTSRDYNKKTIYTDKELKDYEALTRASEILGDKKPFEIKAGEAREKIGEETFNLIKELDESVHNYQKGEFSYTVRGKEIKVKTKFTSLAGSQISRVGTPKFSSLADKYKFIRTQN